MSAQRIDDALTGYMRERLWRDALERELAPAVAKARLLRMVVASAADEPLFGARDRDEIAALREPVFIVPPHIAPGLDKLHGMRIIRANVPGPMVAFL